MDYHRNSNLRCWMQHLLDFLPPHCRNHDEPLSYLVRIKSLRPCYQNELFHAQDVLFGDYRFLFVAAPIFSHAQLSPPHWNPYWISLNFEYDVLRLGQVWKRWLNLRIDRSLQYAFEDDFSQNYRDLQLS